MGYQWTASFWFNEFFRSNPIFSLLTIFLKKYFIRRSPESHYPHKMHSKVGSFNTLGSHKLNKIWLLDWKPKSLSSHKIYYITTVRWRNLNTTEAVRSSDFLFGTGELVFQHSKIEIFLTDSSPLLICQ